MTNCPKFTDFTRECITEIEFVPTNTIDFCSSEKYLNCPFYRVITKDPHICKNINKCPAFKNFELEDFEQFVDITNKYCVSDNHINCKRFIIKEKGEIPPINLHPDGRFIAEWSDKKTIQKV